MVLPRKQTAKIVALEPTVKIAAVPMPNHCVKNATKEDIWKQWGHTAVTVAVVSRARQGTYKMLLAKHFVCLALVNIGYYLIMINQLDLGDHYRQSNNS